MSTRSISPFDAARDLAAETHPVSKTDPRVNIAAKSFFDYFDTHPADVKALIDRIDVIRNDIYFNVWKIAKDNGLVKFEHADFGRAAFLTIDGADVPDWVRKKAIEQFRTDHELKQAVQAVIARGGDLNLRDPVALKVGKYLFAKKDQDMHEVQDLISKIPSIRNEIYKLTYQIAKDNHLITNEHPDFGRVAFQGEEGFSVPGWVKHSAITQCLVDVIGPIHFQKQKADVQPRVAPPPVVAAPPRSQFSRQDQAYIDRIAQIARSGCVHFYDIKVARETNVFSNFHEQKFTFNGIEYYNGEAAFQAAKLPNDPAKRLFAAKARTGNDAYRLKPANLPRDWFGKSYAVMLDVLRAKFADPFCKACLLATGDAYLNEHSPIVGRGFPWTDNGEYKTINDRHPTFGDTFNQLGRALMQIRGEFGGTGVVQPYGRLTRVSW